MKVLVTGGSGFLGQAICRRLIERGLDVRSFARTRQSALNDSKVEQVEGDVRNLDAVLDASRGCVAVIHTAAKAGAWGALDDYYDINVGGTDHVIAACHMNKIRRLVYTSTPSVVHSGSDLEGVDERVPYATRFVADYPATKAIAEQHVLAANSAELATVALRPHLIWGPGDRHLLPRVLARARSGTLRFIGKEAKRIDTTYIDNAAEAHVLALEKLAPGAACAGKAYFISQGEPVLLDEMVNALLKAAGMLPERRRVPFKLAYAAGALLEKVYGLLRIAAEPPMTRFVAEQLSTAHWFNIAAAKRDLGYAPSVRSSEGLSRLAEWLMREARRGK